MMVIGSCSFMHGTDLSLLTRHFHGLNDSSGPEFHSIVTEFFAGGYFTHPGLPYTSGDTLFTDETNDILILLSGSVYNMDDLLHADRKGKTSALPEIIARLFIEKGPGFVCDLNGDFAIFILRPQLRSAWLFRDHVGTHPMAYNFNNGVLSFSSDVNGLCRALPGSRPPDTEFLLGYFKYIDYAIAADKRVRKLPPGHYLEYSDQKVSLRKYWFPEKIRIDRKLDYELMLAGLKHLVHDSVRIRCDRRFMAGAEVSGGLDSGIVSLLARREYKGQEVFYGFSWSPLSHDVAEAEYDERDLVKVFCEKAGITPVFSDMNRDDLHRYISGFYFNRGYFSSDKTVEQAAASGVNLLFSGWGGDEFISTGDRGIESDLLRGLHLRTFFRRNPVRNPRKFVRWFLNYVVFPAAGVLDKATLKSFRDDARHIRKPYAKSNRKAIRNFYFYTSRRQLHLGMLRFYHLQERCESWAVNSFRKGVEYRYPLLDRRIIEYMLKVPSLLLCRTGHFRPLLREISADILPAEIRWQLLKNDPVYWSYMNRLFRETAEKYMEEVSEMESCPDMHFTDFKLLREDIALYRHDREMIDPKVLCRSLVYLKAAHEFSLAYRENPKSRS